jgi:PncC family amidohydrolase
MSTTTTNNTQKQEPSPSNNITTDSNLAKATITHLHATNQTLATAESLTAGQLTSTLASVPGASTVVRGGVVAYATPLKHTLLGVDGGLLEREGAVDPRVVVAMARGVRGVTRVTASTLSPSSSKSGGGGDSAAADATRTGGCDGDGAAYGGEKIKGESEREGDSDNGITDWGVATTGVAGPDPQDGKPAGTVYIGVASAAGARAWGPFMFPGGWEEVQEAAVTEALVRLREAVVDSDSDAPAADINALKDGGEQRV